MANITYNDHPVKAAPAAGDYVPIWDVTGNKASKALRSALVGATLTGGGVIALGGYTLTVPATGTAALRDVAGTFSAVQTFSAGINLGAETLTVYDEGVWTPELQGSGGNPTSVTYAGQTGQYTRIGDMVFFAFQVTVTSFTGGAGTARISLPLTARNPVNLGAYRCAALVHNVTIPAAVQDMQFSVVSGAAVGALSGTRSATSSYTILLSDLGASALIQASGIYHV